MCTQPSGKQDKSNFKWELFCKAYGVYGSPFFAAADRGATANHIPQYIIGSVFALFGLQYCMASCLFTLSQSCAWVWYIGIGRQCQSLRKNGRANNHGDNWNGVVRLFSLWDQFRYDHLQCPKTLSPCEWDNNSIKYLCCYTYFLFRLDRALMSEPFTFHATFMREMKITEPFEIYLCLK